MSIPNWKLALLADLMISKNDKSKQIKSTEYNFVGKFPIVDQSSKFICGYSDDVEKVINFNLPLTVFGDHTRHTKFISFPFIAGADGTQLLKSREDVDDKFFYYLILFASGKIGNYGYDRHFKHLREFPCSYPKSKPEQSKIAEVLSKVDQAIEQTESLIAKQQRIKTGLMQDLLTRGIDEHGNLRSEETHEFKDSPLGRIPVEWEVKPFNECVSIVEGQRDPRKLPYQEWILIAPDHIESKTGRLLETKTSFEQGAISGKYEFQSGDVVYSKIRPYLRKAVQVKFSGLCSADMYPLRPKESLSSDFLFLIILSEPFSLYAESVSERSGFPKINRSELSEFRIITPKIEEQIRVSEFLKGQAQYVERLNKSLVKLCSLKTALMQDLLTGKVRVTPLMENMENPTP